MGGSWLQATKRRDGSTWRDCIAQCWQRCLDLALVLWIVRVPLCAVIVGFLILDYTPQAQDLFTEFADSYVRIAVFLVLLTTVWAATTHYAGRLLLDTDMRFRAYADPRVWTYLGSFERWVPRLLGLIPFAVVLIASERSIFNLPHIEDKDVIAAITCRLRIFDALVVAVTAAFLVYMVKRRISWQQAWSSARRPKLASSMSCCSRSGWAATAEEPLVEHPETSRRSDRCSSHRFPALRCGYHLRCRTKRLNGCRVL